MIKPIRTEIDLKDAKSRIKDLLQASNNLNYDDEIEVLATLIEQYEKKYFHIESPSPIAAIKFRMDALGLSPKQLEPFIGSRARVSEVLSGKRQLSIDMIRSLHQGLGIPYESLISSRADKSFESESTPALNRLSSMGFKVGPKELDAFLSPVAQTNLSPALLRKTRTQRAASKTDQHALLLWQAAVVRKSENQRLKNTFEQSKFGSSELRSVARISARTDGPTRVITHLAKLGICVVILPPLPGTFLDGAAMVDAASRPVVGLTLRHDRLDNFWFTLLHELAHISLHYDYLRESGSAFIDDIEINSDDAYEREADLLAQESLIPSDILSQFHWAHDMSQDDVTSLSIQARVNIAIVAGRWQRDHQNYKKFSRLIERGTLRTLFEMQQN
ncbi:MAG: ImmA/IrrE family metallo-endopeptidase [Alphaproteobacteria bacterium]